MNLDDRETNSNDQNTSPLLPAIDPALVDNAILRVALERVRQRAGNKAHMGHYTKHSSHSSHSKSSW